MHAGLLVLASFFFTMLSAQQNILQSLQSPIIFKGNDSIAYRDPAILYHNKMFYLFFTMVKSEADGKVYSYTTMSTSKDLRKWSDKKIITPRNQNLDYSSPGNVARAVKLPSYRFSIEYNSRRRSNYHFTTVKTTSF